jgi:flagellar motor switch protein FliN/FliY
VALPPGRLAMTTTSADARDWLIEEFAARLASVFETMAGGRPPVVWEPVSNPPPSAKLFWRQAFSGIEGAVWVAAGEPDWSTAGGQVLRAAGIEDSPAASVKSTYLEVTGQALSGLTRAMSARLGREVTDAGGEEAAAPLHETVWMSLRLMLGTAEVNLAAGFETALLNALRGTASLPSAPESTPAKEPSDPAASGKSKTYDLLLEVELPVSVSFGRAQMPLKDVLKLTTGSIVELNRSISEPVEVIVNNCVIARGEVVVVEGNFGVRIQQVISRQERLRTLN